MILTWGETPNPLTYYLSFLDTSVLPLQYSYTMVGSLDRNLDLIILFWGHPQKINIEHSSYWSVSGLALLFSLFCALCRPIISGSQSKRTFTEARGKPKIAAVRSAPCRWPCGRSSLVIPSPLGRVTYLRNVSRKRRYLLCAGVERCCQMELEFLSRQRSKLAFHHTLR